MIKEYKSKTNIFIGIGLLVSIGATFLLPAGALLAIARLIGYVLVIVGCVFYAKGKGYHGAWGLLGMLSLLGLLVLICFPDKRKV